MDDMSFALFLSPGYAETQLGIAFYRTTWSQADGTGPVAEALLDDFETEQGLPWPWRRGWPNSLFLIQWNTSIFYKKGYKKSISICWCFGMTLRKTLLLFNLWQCMVMWQYTDFEWENRDGIPSWSLISLGQVCEPLRRCWRKAHMGCIF